MLAFLWDTHFYLCRFPFFFLRFFGIKFFMYFKSTGAISLSRSRSRGNGIINANNELKLRYRLLK